VVYYNGKPPNWNPPFATVITIPYKTPAYRRYYERFWWDDNRPFDWLPYNENYRRQIKPCQHYKCYTADAVDVTPWNTLPWNVGSITSIGNYLSKSQEGHRLLAVDQPAFRNAFGRFGEHNAGLPSMVANTSDQRFISEPIGLNVLTKRALASMLPDIKSGLSLVNSIIELKDFKSLPHTAASIDTFVTSLPTLIKNIRRLYSKRAFVRLKSRDQRIVRRSFSALEGLTLRELFRAPADAWLQVKFNIMPLLSDICAIYDALSGLERLLKDLQQRQGRLQRRHYTYVWESGQFAGPNSTILYPLSLEQFAGSTNPPGTSGCLNSISQLRCIREVIANPSTFHAELEYRYYLSQFQNEHAHVLSLLDSLGVNLNPQIIWNAIPWSFVVDWVLGVSRWLGDRKVLNMEPRISIERYLWSWKYTRRVRVSVETSTSSYVDNRINKTYMPDLYEEAYRRDVVMPSYSDPIFMGGLDSTELSLGVSLAITRRRRPNTRMRG